MRSLGPSGSKELDAIPLVEGAGFLDGVEWLGLHSTAVRMPKKRHRKRPKHKSNSRITQRITWQNKHQETMLNKRARFGALHGIALLQVDQRALALRGSHSVSIDINIINWPGRKLLKIASV